MKQRYTLAREWVLEMGKFLQEVTRNPFDYTTKTGHQDIVTAYDQEVERFFRSRIRKHFPEDSIVGEELSGKMEAGAGVRWYIDPIDGTTNFVNQRKHFAISVGCYRDGLPQFSFVLDVIGGDLYSAAAGRGAYKNDQPLGNANAPQELEKMILSTPNVPDSFWRNYPWQASLLALAERVRAVRSLGSVALELCAVAEGSVDIFVAMRSAPWDHNGARLILQESGCQISQLGRDSLCTDEEVPVLACRTDGVYRLLKEQYGL